MKYIDEYRDKETSLLLAREINKITKTDITLMEVCGGHTMSMHRFGIGKMLPDKINLLSGPGCPVCVTSIKYIDQLIAYSRLDNVIIATFGDLIRVPGSTSSLQIEKSSSADIRIVYSSMEALEIARVNKEKRVIFSGIGFETTAPTSAIAILEAKSKSLDNFFVFSSHKAMPPAMEALIDEGVLIDGYVCPGHVSTITGTEMYRPIVDKYKVGCVISGFEPVDMLQSIYMLVKQINSSSQKVEIQYKRAVKPEGNLKAKKFMDDVFEYRDDYWRGLGILKQSGFKISERYKRYDAEENFDVDVEKTVEPKGCICGLILKGQKKPTDCKLFAKVCEPINPIGACMVSAEGSCSTHYKYRQI